jgi:hypothetical protein
MYWTRAVILVWVVLTGVFYGLSINAAADRCGHPITTENYDPWLWLAWPIVVVAATVIDEDAVTYDACADMQGDGGVP